MLILVDIGPSGEHHLIETDPTKLGTVADPVTPAQQISIVTLLTRLSGNVALQTAGGWAVMNKLPGEAVSITRWQRLLNAVNALPAADPLRLLNLV